MSPLLDRKLSATRVLLLLGVVLMVTSETMTSATQAQRRLSCRQELPAELIRDLWSRSKHLINSLPKEEKSSWRFRLLPKFCTICQERQIGWQEMREMIDIYQRRVFSSDVIQKLLPLHFNDLLDRMRHTLHHCVSLSKPSKWFHLIKKVERKIKKRRNEGVMKAVREFPFMLRWMDELTQHNIL
ncbi:interleukin-26 [Genypterus blacodes]|uniref:interleukin-26 n=1 Tax=Genypterus blacodes TaxID=154954 RepID=UPI003F76862D